MLLVRQAVGKDELATKYREISGCGATQWSASGAHMDFVTIVICGVGVLQVPILMDLLDNAFPRLGIGRATRWGLSKLLFVLLVGFCGVALYYFFTTFLPLY